MKKHSAYQQKLIRNYYENREAITLQTLGEIVSELYLANNETKRTQLWRRAETALKNLGVDQAEAARIVKGHDLAALAKLVSREF